MMPMEQILAVFVLWAAGIGLFFFWLNRWVLFTRDFRAKTPIIIVVFLLLNGGSLWYGWRAGFSLMTWGALGLLILQLLGEARRIHTSRTLAGAPPVWQQNVAEHLAQPFTTTTFAIRRYEVRLPAWRGPRLRIA